MRTISELTPDEFTLLLDEYFAPAAQRTKMTPDEVKSLATRLNDRIDVPLIRETREQKILIKIVIKIDNFLYSNLPNEFYDLIRSLDNGIDDDEAERLTNRLTNLANSMINIPYVPEVAEGIAIRFIISTIIDAARKGKKLE